MLYRDTNGNEEWIWNSRDGVTPYGITSRQGFNATHCEWSRDRCVPDHKPNPGDRIFVDLTIERAREHRREFVDKWWNDARRDGWSARYESKEEAIELLAQEDLTYGGGPAPDLIEVTAERRLAVLDADTGDVIKEFPLQEVEPSSVPAAQRIPALWFDSDGFGPDHLALELHPFAAEMDGRIPAYLGLRVRSGGSLCPNPMVDGGFNLSRASVETLRRQLTEWLDQTAEVKP